MLLDAVGSVADAVKRSIIKCLLDHGAAVECYPMLNDWDGELEPDFFEKVRQSYLHRTMGDCNVSLDKNYPTSSTLKYKKSNDFLFFDANNGIPPTSHSDYPEYYYVDRTTIKESLHLLQKGQVRGVIIFENTRHPLKNVLSGLKKCEKKLDSFADSVDVVQFSLGKTGFILLSKKSEATSFVSTLKGVLFLETEEEDSEDHESQMVYVKRFVI